MAHARVREETTRPVPYNHFDDSPNYDVRHARSLVNHLSKAFMTFANLNKKFIAKPSAASAAGVNEARAELNQFLGHLERVKDRFDAITRTRISEKISQCITVLMDQPVAIMNVPAQPDRVPAPVPAQHRERPITPPLNPPAHDRSRAGRDQGGQNNLIDFAENQLVNQISQIPLPNPITHTRENTTSRVRDETLGGASKDAPVLAEDAPDVRRHLAFSTSTPHASEEAVNLTRPASKESVIDPLRIDGGTIRASGTIPKRRPNPLESNPTSNFETNHCIGFERAIKAVKVTRTVKTRVVDQEGNVISSHVHESSDGNMINNKNQQQFVQPEATNYSELPKDEQINDDYERAMLEDEIADFTFALSSQLSFMSQSDGRPSPYVPRNNVDWEDWPSTRCANVIEEERENTMRPASTGPQRHFDDFNVDRQQQHRQTTSQQQQQQQQQQQERRQSTPLQHQQPMSQQHRQPTPSQQHHVPPTPPQQDQQRLQPSFSIAPSSQVSTSLQAQQQQQLPRNNTSATGVYEGAVGLNLLRLSEASASRAMLNSLRPAKNERFSGDDKRVDFESSVNLFKGNMKLAGATKSMANLEWRHYYTGNAYKICALYEREIDPEVAYHKTLSHLKREYGYRTQSSVEMLESVLKGGQINGKNYTELKNFTLDIEGIYKKAQESKRSESFHTQYCLNRIFQTKLEFAAQKWSDKQAKIREDWDSDDEGYPQPNFDDFLKFLRRIALKLNEYNQLLGKSDKRETKSVNVVNAKKSHSVDVKAVNVSNNRGGGHSNRGRGGKGRGGGNSNRGGDQHQQNVVSTPAASNDYTYNVVGIGGGGGGASTAGRGGYRGGNPTRGFPSRGRGSGRAFFQGAQPSDFNSRGSYAPRPAFGGATPTRPVVLGNNSTWSCHGCGETAPFHYLAKCDKFVNMSPAQRHETVQKFGDCLLCLGRRHVARDCKNAAVPAQCSNCCKKHHRLLCKENPSGNSQGVNRS